MSRRALPAVVLTLLAATAGPSWAQAPAQVPAEAPKPPAPPWELTIGAPVLMPVSLGSTEANLLDSGGGAVPLFRTTNETGWGFGLEATVGAPVARRFDVEMSGAWTRYDVQSIISDDFEDVAGLTLSNTVTRFSVEGAVLWRFAEGIHASWFVRGSGGWMRELSEDASLVEDGLLVSGGVGVKYWPGASASSKGRFGLRAEFRAVNRRNGIEIDDESFRIWPVVTASAVVRF